jgi:ferrous iron transport protein A
MKVQLLKGLVMIPLNDGPFTLNTATLHASHRIASVRAPEHAPEWAAWLQDIGFTPKAKVAVVARAAFGGDPLLVRVDSSTFALRRAEAQCIHLEDESQATATPNA